MIIHERNFSFPTPCDLLLRAPYKINHKKLSSLRRQDDSFLDITEIVLGISMIIVDVGKIISDHHNLRLIKGFPALMFLYGTLYPDIPRIFHRGGP